MSTPSNTSVTAPQWAQNLRRFNNWLLFNVGGGPRPLKLATVINIQKGGSLPLLAFLIWWYADLTPAATSTA